MFNLQVTVADINTDSQLDLVAIDTSGNVACVNNDGTLAWEVEISGTSSPGSRLVDVDSDGYVEVLIPTNTGYSNLVFRQLIYVYRK